MNNERWVRFLSWIDVFTPDELGAIAEEMAESGDQSRKKAANWVHELAASVADVQVTLDD